MSTKVSSKERKRLHHEFVIGQKVRAAAIESYMRNMSNFISLLMENAKEETVDRSHCELLVSTTCDFYEKMLENERGVGYTLNKEDKEFFDTCVIDFLTKNNIEVNEDGL